MSIRFSTAYKDGFSNGVGCAFAVAFTLYFYRREDLNGVAIGFFILFLTLLSIGLVMSRYKDIDKRVDELTKEIERPP